MDNETVATHYNVRKQESRKGRQQSPIINMRNFNNWLKSVLINLHTRPGYSVLDLCCGKGGDLRKWDIARISTYVGSDIAEISVRQAAERYSTDKGPCTFKPFFLVGDACSASIADHLEPDHMFDAVSCQFAIHYAFGSEVHLRQLLRNVSDRLKPGGFFFGTTADANVLVRKLRATDGLQFGNAVFEITFDEAFASKRFPRNNPYGHRYLFTLADNVVECPEFLVHFPTFEKMALEYDLELQLLSNFHDFFCEFSSEQYPELRNLMFNMRVLNEEGTIPIDQWDAIYLYSAFSFRKTGGEPNPGMHKSDVIAYTRQPLSEEEIVIMTDKGHAAGSATASGDGFSSGGGLQTNGRD